MSEEKQPSTPPIRLHFLAGSKKGTSMPVETTGKFRIGRDPECEIHLPEPNVSRVHARLVWDGSVLVVEDLRSTNGIFVNGEKVVVQKLDHNDVVALGAGVFRLELRDVAASTNVGHSPTTNALSAETMESSQFRNLFECMLAIQRILSKNADNMIEECLKTLFMALPITRLCLLQVNENNDLNPWFTTTVSGTTREFTMSKTFARKVQQAGKGILIHDAQYLDSSEWGSTMQQQEVRSILGVPVFIEKQLSAILLCDNLQKPNILTNVHVQTLEFFGKALETVFQRDRIRRLEESQANTEREFLAAKRVQKQIFTKQPSAQMGGMQWSFYYRPALQVGGDFYDFYEEPDRMVWIVADVSGKGVSAALVVSMLKAYCKILLPQGLSPRQILIELNNFLLGELPPEMFLTAVICETRPSGAITYANAGHQPVFVTHPESSENEAVDRLKSAGIPLGFLVTEKFTSKVVEETYQLTKGDKLVLYTDGLTEAADSNQSFFGEKRLISQLAQIRALPIQQGLDSIIETVDLFQGTGGQHDDVTMVLGEY